MTLFLSYWWVLALISGLGLATRNIMFKVGSGHMDAAMGALVLSLSMAVVHYVPLLRAQASRARIFFWHTAIKQVVMHHWWRCYKTDFQFRSQF